MFFSPYFFTNLLTRKTTMHFYHYLTIFILSFPLSSLATTLITCPTTEDIKSNNLKGWLPLYIENEELASHQDVEKFKQSVIQFDVARWSNTYLENGHCFYLGSDNIVSHIIFAHDAWRPSVSQAWSWITPNALAECKSYNSNDCAFVL